MNRMWTFLGGIGMGVGVMYLLDPDGGARRRSVMRDKAVRFYHDTQDYVGKAGRDLGNRLRGVAAHTTGVLRSPPTDAVLEERVRAKLGRWVSHPRAIEVWVDGGHVALHGPVLENEVDDLLRVVRRVSGVRSVENCLESHRSEEDVPALQGGTPPPGEPAEWEQRNWSPGIQVLAGIAGLAGVTALALFIQRQRAHHDVSAFEEAEPVAVHAF